MPWTQSISMRWLNQSRQIADNSFRQCNHGLPVPLQRLELGLLAHPETYNGIVRSTSLGTLDSADIAIVDSDANFVMKSRPV